MKRLLSLLLTVVFALSGAFAAERPPNFVVIFVDDMGYADLACFGSPDILTPRLDALAEQGMRFTHFYAQPVCGPSRAALMTGCYPLRLAEKGNVKEIHPVLHTDEITLAEVLKQKGYVTGCFGKWDLARHSQNRFEPDLMPNHQGFDYFFGTPTSNDGFVDLYRNEERIEEKADMGTLTKRYTDEVIRFIATHREKPFFAYVPYTMVHTRLDASPDFKGKSPRGLYGDAVEEIDFNCGRIIDLLKELELVENTYFLFTSDNGPWLIKNKDHQDGQLPSDHGGSAGPLRSGKVSTWEGGVRVPTILWAPNRVPANTQCDKVVATIDILPTFAGLAGAEVPADRVIDGVDVAHLFAGNFEEADDAPFGIAPIGLQGLMWPRSTEILAKAAHQHNIPFVLSTVATASIETVAELTEGNAWFQLYHQAENELRDKLLDRAADAGFPTLVILADTPTFAYRPKEIRNGLSIPPKVSLRNIAQMMAHPTWSFGQLLAGAPEFKTMKPYVPKGLNMKHLALFINKTFSGRLNPDKIAAIRDRWKGKLVVKGIVNPEEAEKAISLGVDGIIVSNHGGRQLDAGQSTIKPLTALAKEFGDRTTLMIDSGVRNGPDVACALASGAGFAFLGRSFMYGVGALGKAGGDHTIMMLKRQLQQVMEQVACEQAQDSPNHLITSAAGSFNNPLPLN